MLNFVCSLANPIEKALNCISMLLRNDGKLRMAMTIRVCYSVRMVEKRSILGVGN